MNGRSWVVSRWTLVGALLVGLGLAPGVGVAQEGADRLLTAALELALEHDDNVALASGEPGEPVVDDLVVHLRPELLLQHTTDRRLLSLEAVGDLRRGTGTDLEEYNASLTALADLSFPRGWGLRLEDDYARTGFDQAILFTEDDVSPAEAGVARTEVNTYGATLSFSPRRRFLVSAMYEAADESYDFGSDVGARQDERDVGTAELRLTVPLRPGLQLLAHARSEDQSSAERITRVYDDRRGVVGLEWNRGARATASLEVGREEIDFADTAGVEFEKTVALLVVEVKLAEDTLVSGSLGVDGFGELVYDLLAARGRPGGSTVRVRVRRMSQPSLSIATVGQYFEATLLSASWQKALRPHLLANAELSYVKLSSPDAASMDEDTGTATLRLERELSPWLYVGAAYRYAMRAADTPLHEFDDNRLGVFLGVRR